MSKTISVRLPNDLCDELDDVSLETERSKSFHITKALKKYFEDLADYQIALDRLNDKDDELISSDELREELGL